MKTNNLRTNGINKKSKHDASKQTLIKKIEDINKNIFNTNDVVSKSNFNGKVTEMKSNVPSTNNLVKKVFLVQKYHKSKLKYEIKR